MPGRGSRKAWWWKRLQVDAEDAHLLDDYSIEYISAVRGYYRVRAVDRITGKGSTLARLIAKPAAGMVVDHINGDPLDNRRCNLRVCRQAENARNTRSSIGVSQFKGVSRKNGGWQASIGFNNRNYYLGVFSTEDAAAAAYDEAARKLHGEFACLNFEGVG